MEIKLNRDSVSYYSKVLSIEFSQEETAENIVPDTLPDIGTVIDADASAILRGKDISDGRITVSGMIFGYIIYRSEGDNELRRMPVQLPFSAHWDNSCITQTSKAVVRLSLSSFEGRIINSRKLLLRAEVVIAADIFNAESCEYTTGAECDKLEYLKENISFNHISAIGERAFNISEELQLPAGKTAVEGIVKYRAKLCCDEVKAVGSRLVVKGNACVNLIYSSGENSGLSCADFRIPFSQIYDTDCRTGITAADASLMLTGCFVELNSYDGEPANVIRAEIGAVAQFCAWSESEINCLCDAYSTQNEIAMNLCSAKLKESRPGAAKEDTVSQIVNISDGVKSIVDAYIYVGRQRAENGVFVWPVSARVIYEGEGGVINAASTGFEIRCEAESGGAKLAVEVGDISSKVISGGAELRISVKYKVLEEDELGFATPELISIDEECIKDISLQPSIVVLKADGITSLWSIAKAFNTTISTINEANPDIDGSIPQKGELLLIAKKR